MKHRPWLAPRGLAVSAAFAALLLCGTSARAQEAAEAQSDPDTQADAEPKLVLRPGLEVFAGYRLTLTNATDDGSTEWFHEFALERAFATLEATYGDASSRIILEAVPSADPGALVGVSGDSFVARIREAWAGYRFFRALDLRLGIVPQFTLPQLRDLERLQPIGRNPLEAYRVLSAADLGATLAFTLPARYGVLGVGVYNGEGYESRELNRGKNLELFTRVHPLAHWPAAAPLGVALAYQHGSTGTGSARANRATAILFWEAETLSAGVAGAYIWGFENDGARDAWFGEAFARADLFEHLIVGGRGAYFGRDTDNGDDNVLALLGTVGARAMQGVELYLSLERRIPGIDTELALPNTDDWRFQLTGRVTLGP